MELPDVRNTLHDRAAGVTYHVLAYRTLTADELKRAVAQYLAQRGRARPKSGSVITIQTVIGGTG